MKSKCLIVALKVFAFTCDTSSTFAAENDVGSQITSGSPDVRVGVWASSATAPPRTAAVPGRVGSMTSTWRK